MRIASVVLMVSIALSLTLVTGCGTTPSRISDVDWVGAVPAPMLYEALEDTIASPLSAWALDISAPGELWTTWLSVPGKKSGLLWWRKQWEARARCSVLIRPTFSDPLKMSEFTVAAQAEERPNERYPWSPAGDAVADQAAFLLRAVLIRVAEDLERTEVTP